MGGEAPPPAHRPREGGSFDATRLTFAAMGLFDALDGDQRARVLLPHSDPGRRHWNFLPESGLHIIAEHFLRIQFHLMVNPGASLDTIRTVHSHVHALGQCRKVIRELGLTPLISGDTAGAAREVAEAADLTQAAIAPPLAAEIYGLEILREDVEDEDHNTTRFVLLSPEYVQAPQGNGPVVTSFVFNVRNLPAALYKATNGINMTKLESYMVGGQFAATQFLAEVDGHPDDPGLKRALEELTFFTTDIKVLGVYPADPFRG